MSYKKSKRTFLLLELLIALFLVGLCILPLVHLPMQALREEIRSAWHAEMHRIADLGLADLKEKLHTRQIKWDTIAKSSEEKIKLDDVEVTVVLPSIGKRVFKQTGLLSSIEKTDKEGVEYHLLTYRIEFQSKDRFKLFRLKNSAKQRCFFNYQLLVSKSPLQESIPNTPPVTKGP